MRGMGRRIRSTPMYPIALFRNFLDVYSVSDDDDSVTVYRVLYPRSDLKPKLI